MAYQNVFKRYECKYLITLEQKEKILEVMKDYMELDQYGRVTIRNLYFDTDTYRLIRHSIEKPKYKEKLRVRSYSQANADSTVFVELKKKYNSVVYKRRIALSNQEAMDWLSRNNDVKTNQISKEIDYFMDYYETLHPVVFLSYEREAYYSKNKDDFRVTFDENILVRQDDLSLEGEIGGTSILDAQYSIMEIKCSGGIPLWMTHVLTKEHIYKTSFSKYGTAYQTLIYPNMMEEYRHD